MLYISIWPKLSICDSIHNDPHYSYANPHYFYGYAVLITDLYLWIIIAKTHASLNAIPTLTLI